MPTPTNSPMQRNRGKKNKPFLDYAYWRWPYCQWCGSALKRGEATADHVLPLSRSGDNTWENKVVSCGPCNHSKGNHVPGHEPMGPRWVSPSGSFEPMEVESPRQIMSLRIIKAICGVAA